MIVVKGFVNKSFSNFQICIYYQILLVCGPGLFMYPSRKPQDGGGWGTPRDSPGTHGELVPRAGRRVSESRGRADLGPPPGGRESRGGA